ncbi:MAG: Glycosyl transferase group 1 [Candidatus Moranbacteria bacterium GW2011_GWE1_35_17]|nr:MAG: Glycosyl transferase group 1 [Candidatus Moranbacteria bacterium GW2011_GWE1_35_17]KKP70484.1 MAG: Glycosyl transferase group 1 [Candidatus Moranbacteria bacterium GW2011_GWE2_35_164]KKP84960.1 MAG: Glycosyl transferase group 1 [Candidatus Moranbacteria bacterium GW2011_GWF2_35_54]
MKIGIDIRCLSEGRRTGVEEYSINLLDKIFKEGTKHEYVLFLNSWKKPGIDLDWIKKYKNVEIKMFHFPNKILNLFLWYLNWPKIDKLLGGVDIFFMPNLNFIALSPESKLILTIHDLSFEYFPESFSFKRRLWHVFINPKKLIKKASKVLAISDSTRDDLAVFYKIDPKKIEVIYNGISDEFTKIDRNNPKLLEVKNRYKLPFNFVLFLGTFEPRKNIIGIVQAYEILRDEKNKTLDRYKLVIAGSNGWKSKEIQKSIINSKYSQDIRWIKFIENEDKVYVYNLASLFVYPSFFEGFGIPPLEAMKCGVPVVAADNSSLVETVGEGGVMVDANRPDEIALASREFLLNKDFAESFSMDRFKQVQKFSWTKSAKKFLEVIEEMK